MDFVATDFACNGKESICDKFYSFSKTEDELQLVKYCVQCEGHVPTVCTSVIYIKSSVEKVLLCISELVMKASKCFR